MRKICIDPRYPSLILQKEIVKKRVNGQNVLVFPCHSALDAESILINLQI